MAVEESSMNDDSNAAAPPVVTNVEASLTEDTAEDTTLNAATTTSTAETSVTTAVPPEASTTTTNEQVVVVVVAAAFSREEERRGTRTTTTAIAPDDVEAALGEEEDENSIVEMTATTTRTTTLNLNSEPDAETELRMARRGRRKEVLQILFPPPPDHVTKPSFLHYNKEDKKYVPMTSKAEMDALSQEVCVICLEPLRSLRNGGVRSQCGHVCGYDSLMEWMLDNGHDDCPTCRQDLFEKDRYDEIDQQVQEREEARDRVRLRCLTLVTRIGTAISFMFMGAVFYNIVVTDNGTRWNRWS